jgi:hypothetical protein
MRLGNRELLLKSAPKVAILQLMSEGRRETQMFPLLLPHWCCGTVPALFGLNAGDLCGRSGALVASTLTTAPVVERWPAVPGTSLNRQRVLAPSQ